MSRRHSGRTSRRRLRLGLRLGASRRRQASGERRQLGSVQVATAPPSRSFAGSVKLPWYLNPAAAGPGNTCRPVACTGKWYVAGNTSHHIKYTPNSKSPSLPNECSDYVATCLTRYARGTYCLTASVTMRDKLRWSCGAAVCVVHFTSFRLRILESRTDEP